MDIVDTNTAELLPTLGSEIPCTCYAVNVPLKVNTLGIVPLDFKGGIKFRTESNSASGVKLKLYDFEVSAHSPVLGKITISQPVDNVTPLGPLEESGATPPTLRQTIFADFTLTIEKPPGGGPPMVLTNTKTARLVNNSLRVFPPQDDVYHWQEPVDLAPVGSPNQVFAQFLPFSLTVSHDPY